MWTWMAVVRLGINLVVVVGRWRRLGCCRGWMTLMMISIMGWGDEVGGGGAVRRWWSWVVFGRCDHTCRIMG